MSYAGNRFIHDADSHIMELPDCLDPYFDPKLRARFEQTPKFRAKVDRFGDFSGVSSNVVRENAIRRVAEVRAQQRDPVFREDADANIMLRKNHLAMGSFMPEDRPRSLDLLGFASQLIFTSFCLDNFRLNQGDDMELIYAAAQAHNRMITDFCSVDRRLLATGYVPLEDFDRAPAAAREAIALGAKAIRIPTQSPKNHSPSHLALDPFWAVVEESGLPIVFHVEETDTINPAYLNNGLPKVKDFHGGDQNLNAMTFMGLPTDVMITLNALIFDGVMDRFPRLQFGVIELGGNWAPSWLHQLDAAFIAFSKTEERLRKLSAPPSDIARRRVRITPFPHENTGWIIANTGPDMCMFSSDYPHVEGGRNPLARFEASLAQTPADQVEKFYSRNYIDLMGAGLAPELRVPAKDAAPA